MSLAFSLMDTKGRCDRVCLDSGVTLTMQPNAKTIRQYDDMLPTTQIGKLTLTVSFRLALSVVSQMHQQKGAKNGYPWWR